MTNSSKTIIEKTCELYKKITNKDLLIRRINISVNTIVKKESEIHETIQFDLFTNYEEIRKKQTLILEKEQTENKLNHTIIDIKNKYGKNALLKGMNYLEKGTTIDRNKQIGGHKA